jgi:CRISPR-associated protein Cas2
MHYVIAYDVTDDGRRNKVARCLESWGRRVQKSVFECDLSTEELREVLERLQELLAPSDDRCHIYGLCGKCVAKRTALGNDVEPKPDDTVVI